MTRKKRLLTKRAMVHSSVRLHRFDRDRAIEAAAKCGIAVSELIRNAIKRETTRLLDSEQEREKTAQIIDGHPRAVA